MAGLPTVLATFRLARAVRQVGVAGAQAEAIQPTLAIFRAAKTRSPYSSSQDGARLRGKRPEANLHKAGYDGWSALIIHPAGTSSPSAADYEVPERIKIAARDTRSSPMSATNRATSSEGMQSERISCQIRSIGFLRDNRIGGHDTKQVSHCVSEWIDHPRPMIGHSVECELLDRSCCSP
jgi:hypothetical protein